IRRASTVAMRATSGNPRANPCRSNRRASPSASWECSRSTIAKSNPAPAITSITSSLGSLTMVPTARPPPASRSRSADPGFDFGLRMCDVISHRERGRKGSPVASDAPIRGHLIAGAEVASASGATFESFDPATAAPIATLADGDGEDVDRAVRAARAALPGWAAAGPMDRTRVLLRLAELIEAHADELAELESRDVGKPIREARGRDVPVAAQTWLHHAGWPTKILGTTNPSDPGVFSYTIREPLGVVGAITPWNYPLVIASWKLAAALACGNTVVHKPAEE